MIQFSKPRRTLGKSMEPFRRFETNAKDFVSGPAVADGTCIRSPVIKVMLNVRSLPALGNTKPLRRQLLPHT